MKKNKLSAGDEAALFSYAQVLADLNAAWTPHSGQKAAGAELFGKGKRVVVLQCGRKWGKTDFAVYCLWLYALTHPKAECYYIAPELKQARELVWDNFRIQSCNTSSNPDLLEHQDNLSKYVKTIRETDKRIIFKNGSFIKIDGSENYNAHRGTRPHFIVYDEAGFMDGRFHTVMEPNLIVNKAPLLAISSPPEVEGFFTKIAEEAAIRDDGYHRIAPTWENDRIPGLEEEVAQKKKVLEARGESDVFQREYAGQFVIGGHNAIFPMVRPDLMESYSGLAALLYPDRKKLEWFVIVDPGYITCFAALIAAYNPFSKDVYLLDCLYETDTSKMSDDQMWPRIAEKMKEIYRDGKLPRSDEFTAADWTVISDENPAGFRRNIPSMFGVRVRPSGKQPLKKDEGLSLIKDQFLAQKVRLSRRMAPLVHEMVNYVRDDKGNIPKRNDHLIDCFRYLNLALKYNQVEKKSTKKVADPVDIIRSRNTFHQDIAEFKRELDAFDVPEGWDFTTYQGDFL